MSKKDIKNLNLKEKIKNVGVKIVDFFGNVKTKNAWKKIRPWSIYIISISLVVIFFTCAISIAFNNFFGPVNKRDKSPILFSISEGASLSSVANQLEDAGLINSSLGIKLLADFTSVSPKIQNGEYVLDRSMSVQDILDVITHSTASAKVVSITLVEGMTVEEFANQLKVGGAISSEESFLRECKNLKNYSDYYFTKPLNDIGNLRYSLEGYLFPDTYEFYADSTNDAVIKKLLSRLNSVYSAQYTERAEDLGLTMHQVITLASIIEKEGRGEDFAKISAVFHNRIKKNMKLESDVTVQYALGIKKLVLTSDQLKTESPYNTYVVSGIPVGPICNPSKDAIKAVLYPDEEILNGGYLYFTLTDPYTGEVKYSKTYNEHLKIKNQYQPVWEAYDKAQVKQ